MAIGPIQISPACPPPAPAVLGIGSSPRPAVAVSHMDFETRLVVFVQEEGYVVCVSSD